MNGRIYDPLLGRMLSADVLVQTPRDLQSYNRYSYVRNNPLRFTDPSGFAIEDKVAGAMTGAALGTYDTAQAPTVYHLDQTTQSLNILSGLARLFGNDQAATRYDSLAQNNQKLVAGIHDGAQTLKNSIDPAVSKLTGSTDVNHPDRVAYENGARAITPLVLGAAGSAAAIKLLPNEQPVENAKIKPVDGSKVSPTLDEGKQGKHVPGHNNFQPGKSELTHPDPQGLLDQHAGTGQRNGQREHVDTGVVVGTYVKQDGTRAETTRVTIHYAQDGTAHIVPAPPLAPTPPPPPPPPPQQPKDPTKP